ncbi:MAG: TolC family protein [Bacteroidetes bacterium]|nr:TolC family protein [Bacteroidota bacterium]
MKKAFIKIAGLISFLYVNPLAAQQGVVKVLNLQECINIGLDHSTAVLKGNNYVAQAGAQVLAAYGQYLPNLVAAAGYNYDRGNNLFSSAGFTLVNENRSQFNYQLTSSLNIFAGNYNNANSRAAKLNLQASNLTLERAKQQITLDITQSYLQVILDKRIVALDSNNLSTSLKREEQLTMLTEVGRKAKTDLYQQQAQTSSDKLLYINAQSRMQNDKILLFQKLRIDSSDNYDIADIPIDDNADAAHYANKDMLVQTALQDRVDLQSANLNVESANWITKKYRSGYLPTVSLAAGLYNSGAYFNSLTVNGVDSKPADQAAIPTQLYKYTYGIAGINASWNIFDRYYTKSNVRIAKLNADNARIDKQDTEIAIVSNVKQAYNDYVNAVQQMETVDKGLMAAQKAYEAVNGKYKEGASDFITEANAQLVLLQAGQSKVQASVNMMLQKKVIDYYVGANAR